MKCYWCEEEKPEEDFSEYDYMLLSKNQRTCNKCMGEYEDETGYCSLDCCLSHVCDYSC